MTAVPNEAELERLGVWGPGWPDAEDRLQVIRRVFELGATPEEVVEASSLGSLGDLALDLSIRPPGETYDVKRFAEMSGADGHLILEMWQALGLPATGPVRVTPDMAEGLRLLTAAAGLFTPETTLALARVVGSSTARMADALVSAFRVDVEAPELGQGTPYSETLEQMTAVTRELLPLFLDAVSAAFRRHMVLVSYHLWDTDEDRAAVVHERAVGFADLVGSTEAVRSGSVRTMATMVREFEELIWNLVIDAGGRVVKLIGDEAMFVIEDPARACAVAVDLMDASPYPVRVGIAHGTVAALYGDFYGATVNLAARLVATAEPSTVAVSESVRRLARGESALTFADLGTRVLKGFDEPVPVFSLTRARA